MADSESLGYIAEKWTVPAPNSQSNPGSGPLMHRLQIRNSGCPERFAYSHLGGKGYASLRGGIRPPALNSSPEAVSPVLECLF